MLTAMLSGTATVLPSGRILRLVWGAGTSANALPVGAGAIVYCEPIPVSDVEQLGVLLFPNAGISVGVAARIQWSPDGVNFVEEKLEQPGAVSGGVPEESPQMTPKISMQIAWPRTSSANFSTSRTSFSSRIFGMAL